MNILNLKKRLLSVLLFAVALMVNVSAYAIPSTVYCLGTCTTDGEDWSTNGISWTLSSDVEPGVDNTGTFYLTADVSDWDIGTTGYLSEFSLKNFGSDASASATGWTVTNAGLSGKGCKSKTTGDALCFTNNDVLNGPSTANDFVISFDITVDDVFPDFTHFKVRWVDEDGDKIGDLISQDISYDVPEPGVAGLLAMGLIGIALVRRRTV